MDGQADETFGPLLAIPEESIVHLASNVASRNLHLPSSGGKLVARISGSYNISHVVELDGGERKTINLVIRVPATGWGCGWGAAGRMTPTAARAMESQVATMRLLRKRTGIPVPEIYALDTTGDNEIGAPHICMSFVPGKPVSEVWFGEGFPGGHGTSSGSATARALSQEELRLRILTSLAGVMARFSCLPAFSEMGSVQIEDGCDSEPDWDEQEDDGGSLRVVESGPFDSVSTFLQKNKMTLISHGNVWNKAQAKVVAALLDCLPNLDSSSTARDDFVLCPPDFDSQNVLVDDQGTVTGLIDWDLARTMPRFVGYARYPSWITRDWDPLMSGWPKMAESEDSPDALERYRAYYNAELGKAMGWQGDWKLTGRSHMVEAIWIAALHPPNLIEICHKFVQVAGGLDGVNALDVLYDIGAEEYDAEEWELLKEGFKRLMC